jgi:hypothetical protein
MSYLRLVKVTDEYKEMVDVNTGVVRRIPFASEKQIKYLTYLRDLEGKPPLKNKPTVFSAKKAIDKLLLKQAKRQAEGEQKSLL